MKPGSEGGLRQVAVIIVDVDKFRSVNTSFGLVVGDSIILTVSRRLTRILGAEGTLARIGGDQFALFLVDQNDPRELAAFAERLRLSLRSPIRIAGQEIVLTGSIGIALHDGSAGTPREMMRNAEVAMHRAKRLGSDRAEIYGPEMHNERAERQQLERDLAQAIQERRLTLLYQPIVGLSNDELIGFEAVVRWQHPKLGIVSPAELMPIAEQADLAMRLGSLVLGRVVADIARWQQELPRPEHPLFVTMCLSSRQLLSPDIIQEVRNARSRSVLPAGTLRLSVPETLVMDNPEQATHVLELLREAGVELWMDGFGTGYSSLAYLGRFPFDAFKIDRALVEWSSHGERDAALVRSVVGIAHELGRKVVGDGVGSAEDAAFLRSIGCHYAQGFHYGEAMGEDEVVRLLRLIRKSERRMRRRGMVRGQEKRKAGETPADVPAPMPSGPSGGAAPGAMAAQAPPFAAGAASPATGMPGANTGGAVPGGLRSPPTAPGASRPPLRTDGGPAPRTLPPIPAARPVTGDRGVSGGVPSAPPRPPSSPPPTAANGHAPPPAPHTGAQSPAHGATRVPRPGATQPAPGTGQTAARPAPPQPTNRVTEPVPSHPARAQAPVHGGTGAGNGQAYADGASLRPRPPNGPSAAYPTQQSAAGGAIYPAHQPQPAERRVSTASLSPSVAASLARLAGKVDQAPTEERGPDGPAIAPNGKAKAAE